MNILTTPQRNGAPAPGLELFWQLLGRHVARLLGNKAHADIVLTLKDGQIQLVRVNQSFLPGNLPPV